MDSVLDLLKKYTTDYYENSEVIKRENAPIDLYRIIVPETDSMFLLGLGKFHVSITKIRPSKDHRIIISVVRDI